MLELLAGAAIALLALGLVLEPLFSPGGGRPVEEDYDEDVVPLEESDSPKVQALLALREIDFDRETGKLSEEDYVRLKARYSRQAIDAIEAEEREAEGAVVVAPAASASVSTSAPAEAATAPADIAEALITKAKAGPANCPHCGPRPETGAVFCSECGRPLAA